MRVRVSQAAVLDQFGLVAAIEEHATRLDGAALRVTVEAPTSVPPLPAAVEVATYLIAREALSNVVNHSGARSAVVRLAIRAGPPRSALLLEVNDEGAGIPEGHRCGVGLKSMRERAEELGGSLSISSSCAGTSVSARLPLGV